MNARFIRLALPVDVVLAERFDPGADTKTVAADAISDGWQIMDIGPETVALFKDNMASACLVVWNGPWVSLK